MSGLFFVAGFAGYVVVAGAAFAIINRRTPPTTAEEEVTHVMIAFAWPLILPLFLMERMFAAGRRIASPRPKPKLPPAQAVRK